MKYRCLCIVGLTALLAACAENGDDLVLTPSHAGSVIVGQPSLIRFNVGGGSRGEATVSWSMANMPMSERSAVITAVAPGLYEERSVILTMSGRWYARVVIKAKKNDMRATDFVVDASD